LIAVTSFSESYEKYGLKCLESLVKNFPGKILAFYEAKPLFAHEKIEYRNQLEIPVYLPFLERIKRHPGSDGFGPHGYDFRFDAKTFCRKVFAQDAAFDLDSEVFWFDADSVAFASIPEEFLKGLVKEVPFCYLGRSNALGTQSYTETGFLGFNTQHHDFKAFRDKYLSYFTSGRIFSQLKGWHDCIAFDYARQGIKGNNLTPNGRGMNHVLLHSPLAQYIDHYKGDRKELGYSKGHPAKWWEHVPDMV
jgi:hypothetical protein